MEKDNKVFVFGIDGAPPELIFDRWKSDLPTIQRLMREGCYAKLNSTVPPSTIIAWSSMMSGKNPAEFDVYSYTYENEKGETKIVSSDNLKTERIWDLISRKGKKSIVLNVPLTYPVKPFNGFGASGFLGWLSLLRLYFSLSKIIETTSCDQDCPGKSYRQCQVLEVMHDTAFLELP